MLHVRADWARRLLARLTLAVIYTFAGKLGLALAFVNRSATAVWPPTGIALAAVVVLGPGVWPGIFLGAFLTNEFTAGTATTSLLIAAGNTLEALLGGYFVRRFAGGRAVFDQGRTIFLFVLLAGLISTTVSATIGVTTLSLFGFGSWPSYWPTWFTWWLGDAAGAIVIAPALMLWAADRSVRWSREQWLERSALFVTVVGAGWLVFVKAGYPLTFLCIPICVWAAYRFGPREAATVTCLFSLIAIWGSIHGLGTFGAPYLHDTLLLLQAFMAVTSIVGLTVGAAASGRRHAEERLRLANEQLEVRVRLRSRDLQSAVEKLAASEARLKTIFDAEPACVKLVSHDGVLLEMNRAGLAMLGATDAAQIVGRRIIDVIHPDDRDRFLELHNTARSGTAARGEFRIVGLTGVERWVDSHLVPFDASGGKERQTAVLSVTSDVTERKRLEGELSQTHKMEAIGLLAGGIAHDFNNLITAIGGYTELVLRSLDDRDERREDLQEVAKAAQRAAGMTRQLLAFSRRQILQPTVVDVNAMVADLQNLLRRTIPENIDLEFDLSPTLGPVRADHGRLEQVVLNLAINARDAMPQGGKVRIATGIVDVDEVLARRHAPMPLGRYVRLSVSDSGVGMSPETQARIFEPFFTTKDHGKGTGLGLATVYGIVKQSEGFIWVESEIGRGTTFEVYLPIVNERVAQAVRLPATFDTRKGAHTILLAEDDEAVRRLARDVLTTQGYQVLDARDGDEALAVSRQYPGNIDLLIADVVMPGLSGRGLASHLAGERPDLRVLYTSGYNENMLADSDVGTGAAVLDKPFLPADLLRKVNHILGDTRSAD